MYYDITESGKRLSELRKMKGLTQQQVADELGIDIDTVRKNEQGRRGFEKLETGKYAVLVVEDIYDITRNPEDLMAMMDRINNLGVTIFDLGTMSARYKNHAVEC